MEARIPVIGEALVHRFRRRPGEIRAEVTSVDLRAPGRHVSGWKARSTPRFLPLPRRFRVVVRTAGYTGDSRSNSPVAAANRGPLPGLGAARRSAQPWRSSRKE